MTVILTPEQYQALIVAELGDDAAVTAQIATLWELAAGWGDDYNRYQRAKLRALDLLLGRAAGKVSFKALDGASVSLSDWYRHLKELRAALAAEIGAAEGDVGGYAVGEITQTAPIMADHPPDPNSRVLRGDPLLPPLGGRQP